MFPRHSDLTNRRAVQCRTGWPCREVVICVLGFISGKKSGNVSLENRYGRCQGRFHVATAKAIAMAMAMTIAKATAVAKAIAAAKGVGIMVKNG